MSLNALKSFIKLKIYNININNKMSFNKPDQEQKYTITEPMFVVDILRSPPFRKWLESIFCSIYEEGCERTLEYNDVLKPGVNYFVLSRKGDENEERSYSLSYEFYLATLNCNSVRINLFNSDKLTGKIECIHENKYEWGIKIKTSNNIIFDIWTAPYNNNRITVYRTHNNIKCGNPMTVKQPSLDNSSYTSYATNFELDELIKAILEDSKN